MTVDDDEIIKHINKSTSFALYAQGSKWRDLKMTSAWQHRESGDLNKRTK